jgi:hypothetical protein
MCLVALPFHAPVLVEVENMRAIALPSEIKTIAQQMVLYHETHRREDFDVILQHAKNLHCPINNHEALRFELQCLLDTIDWCKKMRITLHRKNQMKANAFCVILQMLLNNQLGSYKERTKVALERHEATARTRRSVYLKPMKGGVDDRDNPGGSIYPDLNIFVAAPEHGSKPLDLDSRLTIPSPKTRDSNMV